MDFAHWYQERHGYPPFPWQEALAHRFAQGDWPDAPTPPTGAGKTAVIDVWLWARLAEHPVPRRLSYIIDRRLVVDGVQDYAQSLADSLPASERPVIVLMRGGITIDNDWVRDPERPTLIISTLDQAGSRLLFSGYGVSPTAAPIHAALLGIDTLWVLDEVTWRNPCSRPWARSRPWAPACGSCPCRPPGTAPTPSVSPPPTWPTRCWPSGLAARNRRAW